jgi:MtN3 and saliva related transmembrane protein
VSMQNLGLAAGVLTTAAWLPQIARTWRSRSAEDLSWPYLLVFSSGVALWLLYGVLSNDVPVLAANAVTIVLVGLLLGLKSHTAIRATSGRHVKDDADS